MKEVYVRLKGSDRAIKIDAVSIEFMNIGKGILHIITKDREYYYPLKRIVVCEVYNN